MLEKDTFLKVTATQIVSIDSTIKWKGKGSRLPFPVCSGTERAAFVSNSPLMYNKPNNPAGKPGWGFSLPCDERFPSGDQQQLLLS